jgi:hypothetical protein
MSDSSPDTRIGIPLSPVRVQALGGAQAAKERADRVYRTTLARLVKESTTLTDTEKIQLLHDMVCQPPEAVLLVEEAPKKTRRFLSPDGTQEMELEVTSELAYSDVEEAPKTGRYLSPDGTQEMELKVTSELPAPESDVEDE